MSLDRICDQLHGPAEMGYPARTVALVREVLQAQEYWRIKGLSADLIIVNQDPSSYLDDMQAQLTALLDNGPWRMWKHKSGGAYLLLKQPL